MLTFDYRYLCSGCMGWLKGPFTVSDDPDGVFVSVPCPECRCTTEIDLTDVPGSGIHYTLVPEAGELTLQYERFDWYTDDDWRALVQP